MDKIKLLRKELEELYLKEGLTDKVLELSRKLDKELLKIQIDKLDKNKNWLLLSFLILYSMG